MPGALETAPTFAPPHAISWMDRLTLWIDDLPIPTWTFYAALGAATVALGSVFYPVDEPEIPGWMLTILTPFGIGIYHWLRVSTERLFERSRAALDLSGSDIEELKFRLRYFPSRAAWVITAIEATYLPVYVFLGEEAMGYRHLPMAALIPGMAMWAAGEAFMWTLTFQTIRRLVLIARIPRQLARIELFRQQPLHGLSAIAQRGALALFLIHGYVPALQLGREAFQDPVYLWSLVVGAVLAVSVTILPLLGTRRVLVEERRARALANGHRIQVAVDALELAVDAGDQAAIDRELKALGALTTQKALIDGAPTWPWAPGTVRTFATTFLIPVGLLVAREFLARSL